MISFLRAIKYLTPFFFFILAYVAFHGKGWLCWLPVLYGFVIIPVAELIIQPNANNLSEVEEEMEKKNAAYDFILYLVVPLQYFSLYLFLNSISDSSLTTMDWLGRLLGMGILCGVFGVNVAHELGHRSNRFEQFLAQSLLLTSLYMHFFIEHNKGHHKHVGTPHDPSTARYKQSIYAFWWQTMTGTYLSAWRIAIADSKKNKSFFPLINNQMFLFQLFQLAMVAFFFFYWGSVVTVFFVAAALIGGLLLESVNYIEHYGLSRKKTEGNNYERVKPHHSWNSNHVLGRLMLFELSRHSDHHYLASRKYQILRNLENSPQMPTGYPGMIILSLLPPVFFQMMDRRMKEYELI